jgi:hypothetical protein
MLLLNDNKLMKIDLSPLSNCTELTNLLLGFNKIMSIDLSHLSSCVNLKEIHLSSNKISKLDLSILSHFKKLDILRFGSNSFSEVDLSPLSDCQNLKLLRFGIGVLTKLDLSPLSRCTKLRNLSFSNHRIEDIDLAPLAHCKNLDTLHMKNPYLKDIDTHPLLNCPKVIADIPLVGSLEHSILALDVDSAIKHISEQVEKAGWTKTFSRIMDNLDRVLTGAWFAKNKFLLSILDIPELIGFDSNVDDILAQLKDLHSFRKVQQKAQKILVKSVLHQIKSDGSFHLFDEKEMKTKKASKKIFTPLVKARRRENELKMSTRLQDLLHSLGIIEQKHLEWEGFTGVHLRDIEKHLEWSDMEVLFETGYLDALVFVGSVVPISTSRPSTESVPWPIIEEEDSVAYWAFRALLKRRTSFIDPILVSILDSENVNPIEWELIMNLLDENQIQSRYDSSLNLLNTMEIRYHARYNIRTAVRIIGENIEQLSDNDRLMIVRGFHHMMDRDHSWDKVRRFIDRDRTEWTLERHKMIVSILPEKHALEFAKRVLVYDYYGKHNDELLINDHMVSYLREKGEDEVQLLLDRVFFLNDGNRGPEDNKFNTEVVKYIQEKYPDRINELAVTILDAVILQKIWYDGEAFQDAVEHVRPTVEKILGNMFTFAVLGDFLVATNENPELDTWAPELKDWSSPKHHEFNKEIKSLNALDSKIIHNNILLALKHDHRKIRIGACFYLWLTGKPKSAKTIKGVQLLLKTSPDHPVISAALVRITG